MRKRIVKRRPPAFAGGRTSSSLALWSVGQLAPQPDLTRQCAFDLRSRLEILSCRPDGSEPVLQRPYLPRLSPCYPRLLPDHRRHTDGGQWAVRLIARPDVRGMAGSLGGAIADSRAATDTSGHGLRLFRSFELEGRSQMLDFLLAHTIVGVGALAAVISVVVMGAARFADVRRARRRRGAPQLPYRTYATRPPIL
jgi:hypothetical protein